MKDFFEAFKKKQPKENEFVLRKAKVYKLCGDGDSSKDDRIQVKILPNFLGISKDEYDNLPKFPPMFAGTYRPYKTISKDGEENCDLVWVICTRDCQVGYILGPYNPFGSYPDSKYKNSYNFKDIKTFLKRRHALPKQFDYQDIVITTAFETDKGGLVQGYNRITGDWFTLNTTGAVITVQQDQIYMRVGSPPDPLSTGPVGFSAITLTTDKVLIKSPNFELDCQDVVLGKNGLTAGGLMGGTPCIGKNGVPVGPATNIHL